MWSFIKLWMYKWLEIMSLNTPTPIKEQIKQWVGMGPILEATIRKIATHTENTVTIPRYNLHSYSRLWKCKLSFKTAFYTGFQSIEVAYFHPKKFNTWDLNTRNYDIIRLPINSLAMRCMSANIIWIVMKHDTIQFYKSRYGFSNRKEHT